MHVAVGTSLAIMIFTAHASARAHYRLGTIIWAIFNQFWPGIVVGTFLGAVVAEQISTYWLRIIFALYILFVAFKMLLDSHVSHSDKTPRVWLNRLVSLITGFNSGLLGVGGGILIIPYLSYCGVSNAKDNSYIQFMHLYCFIGWNLCFYIYRDIRKWPQYLILQGMSIGLRCYGLALPVAYSPL